MDFRAGEGAGGEVLHREPQGGAEVFPCPGAGTEPLGHRENPGLCGGRTGEEGAAGRSWCGGRGQAAPGGFIGRRRRRRAVPARSHAGPGAALRHRPLAAAAAAAP